MGKIIAAVALAALSLFSLTTGCGGPTTDPDPQTTGSSAPFPEGTTLTGFFIHHMGMAMEPYYILRVNETGTYMKITSMAPYDWRMLGDEDALTESERYFAFVDTVKDDEPAFLKKLDDDQPVRELEKLIEQTGALSWDGFTKRVPTPPGLLDGGESYELYLTLSDGTTVTVDSYNACPDGFGELHYEAAKLFEEICRPQEER